MTIESVRAGTAALLRQFEREPEHVLHVRDLSLQLFDGFQPWHRLGPEDRLILEAGSALHDIGWTVSDRDGQGHHKASARLIREYPWPGLASQEVELIALTARYHRKALPSAEHKDFAALEPASQQRVKLLAAFLRLGDALDRSHRQLVREARVWLAADAAEVHAEADSPIDEELEACVKKGDLLAACFPGAIAYRRA